MTQVFNNQYDADTPASGGETLPLDEIIKRAIDRAFEDFHVWLPAQVTKIRDNGCVDVKPLLKRTYSDSKVVELPVIQNVLVGYPSGEDYWVKLPVAVGDVGKAFFCDKSLDLWSHKGGVVDPQDARQHDLSDAVFVPGLRVVPNKLPGNAADMVLHNGSAELYIQKTGKFRVTNGINELFNLLDQLFSLLENDAYVNTMLGPQKFIASTQIKLSQLQAKYNTLKGS